MRNIWRQTLRIGVASAVLVALAWCTPILAAPFTNFGFTYLDFYVIAILSVLLLGVARGIDYVRKSGALCGGWKRLLVTTIEVYLITLVICFMLPHIARL